MMNDTLSTVDRILALRKKMQQVKVDAWLVLSADAHMSEYLPRHWRGRSWLSGFTGSAGFVVVTQQQAALWTDSRYWEQATKQLQGSGIELMKQGLAEVPDLSDWLIANLKSGAQVGVDGMTLSVNFAQSLRQSLAKNDIHLVTDQDLLEAIWLERPTLPTKPVISHEPQFVALSRVEKIQKVRDVMRSKQATWHLISSLDDIAWLLNLRGSDVPYNPVFLSHLLLSMDDAYLFIESSKLSAEVVESLHQDGIQLNDYADVAAELAIKLQPGSDANLVQNTNAPTLLVDPNRTAWTLCEPYQTQLLLDLNPSQNFKAAKSPIEIAHIRRAMEQDGIALCEFFSAFEEQLQQGKVLTELDVDEQITAARARQRFFVSPSFGTIAGFNANGAMPHYRANQQSHAVIQGNGLLLIDSGGQYFNGTTDITRVIPIGVISSEQKRDFTLVLKAMIALSRAVFPKNVSSQALDSIARLPLWQEGLDFGHGTGHGVGYFLNVHEGPQVISHHGYGRKNTEMKEGMVTSNEPGLYRPGKWGIRIENLVCSQMAQNTQFGKFLKFETLTLCPIDTRCIEIVMLNADEIAWLNHYHNEVRRRLQAGLQGNAKALAWLIERTQEI